jgi:hypothetical protein
MKYDIEKINFLLKKFQEKKSYVLVQRSWMAHFKNQPAPSPNNIKEIVRRFEETCSLDPRPRRKKTPAPRVQEAKSTIKEVICQKPNTSIRELARDTKMSPEFVRGVLLNNLELYPFKIPIYQRLLASDYKKRVDFARWYFTKPWTIINKMIFSDEAYFPLTQPLNRQNNRIWAKEKPSEGLEYLPYDQKVSVFCAISSTKVYGPYFFSTKVNQYNYLEMLRDWLWPKLLKTCGYWDFYFQQDGAPAHTAKTV